MVLSYRTRSGIPPLDALLGGLAPGRIHLLTGGVGTGKTTAVLHFVAAGLQGGETVALVTLDRPEELGAHAAYLGIDLVPALRDGRLTALRYRPEFARRFATYPAVDRLIDDLRRLTTEPAPPARIAIDPVSPLLADGSPVGAGLAAVVEFLEGLGATALLTCRGTEAALADRRLDPVVERAATIASLARGTGGDFEMRIERARMVGAPATPRPFRIAAGVGLTDAPAAATSLAPSALA